METETKTFPIPTGDDRFSTHHFPIEQLPSRSLYEQRGWFLEKCGFSDIQIPSEFPASISTHSTWCPTKPDLDDLTLELCSSDIIEVEIAMHDFQEFYHDLNDLSPKTFPLPTLGPRLRAISLDVHSGRGLSIIHGLDPDKYSLKENVILYAGIVSYIGDKKGAQSSQLDVLSHVKVTGLNIADPRPSLTKEHLPFHTDPGEILCLYVIEPSKSEGKTLLASQAHVYNEIARTKPHLMDILSREDWPHFTARKPVMRKGYPLLYSNKGGTPFFAFTRYALTGCRQQPRPDHVLAPLTDLQADALDTIEFIAAESSLALPQRKGSIFLISNRMYLHARTAYTDDLSDIDRHLIKINLNNSEYGHELPGKLNDRWGHFFKYPREYGKWMLEKDQPESFVSAHQFDRLYFDESTSHSSN